MTDLFRRLPPDADIEQLRRQAKERLRAAKLGDPAALASLAPFGKRLQLATAQLAVAREHGLQSWPQLQLEISRRRTLDQHDATALAAFVHRHPDAAVIDLTKWKDHPEGASPLGYLAMARFDTRTRQWREATGAAAAAQVLLAAGAPVDGPPGARETPLITAASYGDADVAAVLIAAGADLEARASQDAGGVPGGTAMLHAAVFGMTEVIDLLVAAGAKVNSIEEAAAAGQHESWIEGGFDREAGIRALVMAADHQRLDSIDALLQAGVDVDATDSRWGRHPLRIAVQNGRVLSVERLLARGANPTAPGPDGMTPNNLCARARAHSADPEPYDEIAGLLNTPPTNTA
jgi:uncharacterized protein